MTPDNEPEDMGDYLLLDLQVRLTKAMLEVVKLAQENKDAHEQARLMGKSQGIGLALDYLRAYK